MIINLAKKTRLKTANKVCKEDITINPLLQTKTATENGTITPDVGNAGMSKVIVNVDKSPLANLSNPLLPKLGNIKYFDSGRKAVKYHHMMPLSEEINAGADGKSMGWGVSAYYYLGVHASKIQSASEITEEAGYPAHSVGATWLKAGGYVSLTPKLFPACTLKAKILDCSNNEVFEIAHEVKEVSVPAQGLYPDGGQSIAAAFQAYEINLQQDANKRLLAAELVYPKVNITFSSYTSSISYSVDDGETYLPMNDEMPTLVEHILLKSEDGFAWNIRTAGGENVGTIPANGDPFALYATEDTKFWISAVI